MGRHRKTSHSIVWDYVTCWIGPVMGIAGILAGLMF